MKRYFLSMILLLVLPTFLISCKSLPLGPSYTTKVFTVTTYDSNEKVDALESFTFDAHGKMIARFRDTSFVNHKTGKPERFYENVSYKYNKNGQTLEETWYNENGVISLIERFQYDSKGRSIKVAAYSSRKRLKYSYITTYHKNTSETNYYDSKGKSYRYSVEEYDSFGNVVKAVYYRKKHNYVMRYQYKYDGKKIEKMTIVELINDRKALRRSVHVYNKSGEIIKSTRYDGNNRILSQYSVKYNKSGQEMEMLSYDSRFGTAKRMFSHDPNHPEFFIGSITYDGQNRVISRQVVSVTLR